MSGLRSDFLSGLRILWRYPGFAAVSVLTLGLGIGATTAVFSLASGVVLSPLPYPDSERLIELDHTAPGINLASNIGLAPGLYRVYAARNETLEQLGYWRRRRVSIIGAGDPAWIMSAEASASLFQTLQVQPLHGRLLTVEDDAMGSDRVAVLTHGLWQRLFGGDPNVVGRSLELGGGVREIVGVLPAKFQFPDPSVELWLDSELDIEGFGGFWGLRGVALVKESMTIADVRRDLDTRFAELLAGEEPEFRQVLEGARVGARPVLLKKQMVGAVEQTLWILLGTVGFVLLVACANVANLFLVRAETRQREIAVRAALGAGTMRLARHFLAESIVLSTLGGMLGIALAAGGVRFLVLAAPVTIPRLHEVGIDRTVLLFAAAITLGSGVLFGSIPLLRRTANVADALRGGSARTTGSGGRVRARQILVVAQVAFALILLVGSGLMVRSFWTLKNVDPGFDATNVLSLRLSLPNSQYADDETRAAFHMELLDRLAALPGVVAAGAVGELPLTPFDGGNLLYEEGVLVQEGAMPPIVRRNRVLDGYFETLGIPLIAGRVLTRSDNEQRTNALIINEALAELYWPGQDPIGKRVHTENSVVAENKNWMTIVGVVADYKDTALGADPSPTMFLPMIGGDFASTVTMSYCLRTAMAPLALANTVREAIREMNPRLPIDDFGTLQQAVDDDAAPMAFTMLLLGIAAGTALTLGSVGVYGVISYVVRQRTGEIGIRMALGAGTADVRRMLLSQGVRIAAIGVAIGLAGSVALARTIQAVLFGVGAFDPVTYLGVATFLVGVVLLATYVPARRAARIDPVNALRME